MDAQSVYCPRCGRDVRVASTPSPMHRDGHGTIPDDPRLICLDFSDSCEPPCRDDGEVGGPRCPVFGIPAVVMGIERARAGLTPEPRAMLAAFCGACGLHTDHEKAGRSYGLCQACGATNSIRP